MKAELLRGGSGAWNLIIDGKLVAGGHIPHSAPFNDVLMRQVLRISESPDGPNDFKELRGGGCSTVEIFDDVAAALLQRYERRTEKRAAAKAAALAATVARKELVAALTDAGWQNNFDEWYLPKIENGHTVAVARIRTDDMQPSVTHFDRIAEPVKSAAEKWVTASNATGVTVMDNSSITSKPLVIA